MPGFWKTATRLDGNYTYKILFRIKTSLTKEKLNTTASSKLPTNQVANYEFTSSKPKEKTLKAFGYFYCGFIAITRGKFKIALRYNGYPPRILHSIYVFWNVSMNKFMDSLWFMDDKITKIREKTVCKINIYLSWMSRVAPTVNWYSFQGFSRMLNDRIQIGNLARSGHTVQMRGTRDGQYHSVNTPRFALLDWRQDTVLIHCPRMFLKPTRMRPSPAKSPIHCHKTL